MEQEYDKCWEDKAGKELRKIYNYIKSNYSEKSAIKIRDEIISKIDALRIHPERYPPEPLLTHRKENYRFIIVRLYKIIYEFTGHEIRILLIYNTRQNPDKKIEEIE